MHEVLVNRLGGLSLPTGSVVRLTDRPDMTLDVYRGRKTTIQQYNNCTSRSVSQSRAALYIIISILALPCRASGTAEGFCYNRLKGKVYIDIFSFLVYLL